MLSRMRIGSLVVLAFLTASAVAQTPPHNGPRPVAVAWHALRNALVVTAPGEQLEGATIVMREGRITAVGVDVAVPDGATAIDCTGLRVYPGLVEPFYPSDVPALDPDTTDQHWNPMVQPQRNALDGDLVEAQDRQQLRELGYTTVAAVPSGGILKGTSAIVLLDEPTETRKPRILNPLAYAAASLQTNRGGYPNSEMGAIALLRQSLADGRWYARCQATVAATPALAAAAPQPSRVLAALARQRDLPLWFDTRNELQALRAAAVATEFGRTAVLVGSGMEFRRLDALAATGSAIVVPLQLPAAPDVSTAALASRTSLRQLQSWQQAPTNSKRLLDAGVTIAWTTARLKQRSDLPARVRDAQQHGISDAEALAATTTTPARLLGIEQHVGTIAVGKLANLVVTDGGLFDEDRVVRDVFVGGVRHMMHAAPDAGLDGAWTWTRGWPGTGTPALTIDGDSVSCKVGELELEVSDCKRQPAMLTCRVAGAATGDDGSFWLRLRRRGDELTGVCTTPDGRAFEVAATSRESESPNDESADSDGSDSAEQSTGEPALTALATPLGGYGFEQLPEQKSFAIVGATLWCGDGRGVLGNGAVLVRNGKIVFAGRAGDMPDLPASTEVIDATGKHVTTGMIDCHSHTGISRGVNESGQAVTAEVRVQDVVNPDDVNWYRQLAGGVTAVNQLHGSANVIGGQSNTVKLRYGVAHPRDMFLQGGMPGIKFALGENPRRANRSGSNSRYPNTRMGVEGLLRDRLAAAISYAREHGRYEALPPSRRAKVLPPRRDLELEALAEVLAQKRWIHCHSYRQDEIFMLCNLAQEHGIKIGTFQHVLEGYKVADAIKASAVGASSFSDWWAYKFEVYDAIPDNGAIMHELGVNVSFNSDSSEHARRLNTEAGKAVKYGGVAEHEALHFVTRNPAIQLGIFHRTGSLTKGKDADIALWSANPLGYAARCEATWVDGRLMFSLERDRELRETIRSERARLLRLVLEKGAGEGSRPGDKRDAYWAAEEIDQDYCCRNAEEAR